AAFDDCQLPPPPPAPPSVPLSARSPLAFAHREAGPARPVVSGSSGNSGSSGGPSDGPSGEAPDRLCYCCHRIFGRGKIVRHLPPDKVQVNFPGFGLKVILREYLIMEN
ncbi:MAG: ATP-dependent helicase, partial [Desulfovibrionaceae bacterium]|nr:ATP-dependent helicase [Desulfovibrionaceae bacterium]